MTTPGPTRSGHLFDADTALTRLGRGRYRATVSDRWNIVGGHANGGYALATALSGLRAELGRPDPVTVSATYLRRTMPGPAEVQVRVLKSGKKFAFGEAALVQEGRESVRVVASFADLSTVSGPTIVHNTPPVLPEPQMCTGFGQQVPGLSIADRMEIRGVEQPGWMRGAPSGKAVAEFWMRFADKRDPDTFALAAMVDMAPPPVFELGAFGSSTIELSVHIRARPVPGWLACRVTTRHLIDGLHEEDFEAWDRDGHLVAQSRQLAMLPG